jgi:hypothetical protein
MKFEIQPNASGRVYPPDVLRRAIEDARPRMKARRLLGELEPKSLGRTRLQAVSHIVTDMRLNPDGTVVADLEILDTEAGKTLKAMLDGGAEIHATIRGDGTVKGDVVQDDYRLIGVPIIAGPKPWESVVDKLGRLAEEPEEDTDD